METARPPITDRPSLASTGGLLRGRNHAADEEMSAEAGANKGLARAVPRTRGAVNDPRSKKPTLEWALRNASRA